MEADGRNVLRRDPVAASFTAINIETRSSPHTSFRPSGSLQDQYHRHSLPRLDSILNDDVPDSNGLTFADRGSLGPLAEKSPTEVHDNTRDPLPRTGKRRRSLESPIARVPDEQTVGDSDLKSSARKQSELSQSTELPDAGDLQQATDSAHTSPIDLVESSSKPLRKRQFAHRTKSGCHTCRRRKKKCDEGKPECDVCRKGDFHCYGYGPKNDLPPSFWSQPPLAGTPRYTQSRPTSVNGFDFRDQEGRGFSIHHGRVSHCYQGQRAPPGDGLGIQHYANEELPHDRRPRGPDPRPLAQSSLRQSPTTYSYSPIDPRILREQGPFPGHGVMEYKTPFAPASAQSINSGASANYARPTNIPTQPTLRQPTTQLSTLQLSRMSEKEKMLVGQPYRSFNQQLIEERNACAAALERFNDASKPSRSASIEERARLFRAIVEPQHLHRHRTSIDPIGSVGHGVVVEPVFSCLYGYNIHIGDDVVIDAGCVVLDSCKISIGARTQVGPNVKFYGKTMSIDPAMRGGSQGLSLGGSITVEEDCLIGGDVIILPHRTIGKGSVVGAGTVVSRDVEPYTVVAGNPMRFIRQISNRGDADRHRPDIQHQNDISMATMIRGRRRHERRMMTG